MQNTIVILVLLLSTLTFGQYNPAIVSFNAGEVSPFLELRSDFAKYNNACLTLQNMLVHTQGPVTRRPGTKFIADTNDAGDVSCLVPFEYSKTDTYVLEFGDKHIRFFRNGGQIVKTYAAWVTVTAYVIGDLVTNGGNYYRCLIAHTSGTFATDLAAGKWLLTKGAADLAYQIPTTYLKSEVFHIKYAQFGNTMYLVEPNHPPAKLTRTAHTTWTLEDITFTNGPFQGENEVQTFTITPPASPTDITSGQTYLASSETVGHEVAKAFNNNTANGNGWLSATPQITDQWVRCQFSAAKTIKKIRILPCHNTASTTRDPKHLKIEASNNGTDWTKLSVTKWRGRCEGYNNDEVYADLIKTNTSSDWIELTVSNSTAYIYYRIFIYDNWGAADYVGLNEIEMMEIASDIYTASSALFDAGHLNSLWRLNNPRQESSVSGSFASTTNWSDSIYIDSEWDLTLRGNQTAKIELQRTYDDGRTWQTYRVFEYFGDLQYNTMNGIEEGTNVRYRVSCTDYTSGTCAYCLSTRSGSIDEVIKISEVTDSTHVKADLQSGESYPSRATYNWSEGAWSPYRGWPQTIEFYEQRLMFGGSVSYPQTIWATATAVGKLSDYENMKEGVLDSDALIYVIPGQNPIQWLSSQTYLFVGTFSNIGKWGSSSDTEPITPLQPTNYRIQVHNGTAYNQPLMVADAILYLERGTKRVREISYSLERDQYTAPDLTVLAEHITGNGITQLAYQTRPDCILWAVREDGVLLSMTYERQQEVVAWARHITSGTFESVCVIPGTDEDEVWVEVARTVGGATVRYIEQFQPRDYGDYQQDSWFVDSGLAFDGGTARNISAITLANPCQITVTVWPTDSAGTNLADGDQVRITGVVGTTEVNGGVYTVDDADSTAKTFTLDDFAGVGNIDSTKFTAWTSGGTVERVENTFSNLSHLEGLAVTVLADGESQPSETVSGGVITLDVWANTVVAGLAYTSIVETMPVVLEYQSGSTVGKIGRIASVKVNFYKSLGTQYGINTSSLTGIDFYEADKYADEMTPVYTGWKNLPWLHGQTSEATVYLSQSQPLPLTVRAIVPKVTFSER